MICILMNRHKKKSHKLGITHLHYYCEYIIIIIVIVLVVVIITVTMIIIISI